MKYKEFKEKIKEWGEKYNYKPVFKDEYGYFYMKFEGNDYIGSVHKSKRFVIDLNWESYRSFSDEAKKDLFEIVAEFAATKPEDREDEDREENKTFDSIINRLEDVIIDLEEYKNSLNKRPISCAEDIKNE